MNNTVEKWVAVNAAIFELTTAIRAVKNKTEPIFGTEIRRIEIVFKDGRDTKTVFDNLDNSLLIEMGKS